MELALVIVSVVILLIAVFVFLKRPNQPAIDANDYQNSKIELAVAEQKTKSLMDEKLALENSYSQRINKLEAEKASLTEQVSYEKQQFSKIQETFKAQQEKLAEQKQFLDDAQIKFKADFENMANQILKEKSAEFTAVNKLNLDVLLNPLKENIKLFEQKVDQTYKTEAAERFTLKGTIDELIKQTKLIQDDASNLTKALKGDNKKQGNWGEMVLDKLLEGSGLLEGTNYSKQSHFVAEDGNRNLPDVVVFLPDNKHIVIDAKVSLVAYEKLVNAENDIDREHFVKQHVNSIKSHIAGLSGKNYHDLYQINS